MAIDLNQIKEDLQTIFQAANTTTASPVDLSNGMDQRVQQILKLNITQMPVQASFYPFVSVFYENKAIETATISVNQQTGKRKATLNLAIAGAVYIDTFSDSTEDPASDNLENLMENVEEILRSNTTLGDSTGSILWSVPNNVSYVTAALEEETLVRVGIMNLAATVFYT